MNIHGDFMYIVKVTLKDNSVQTFEYEAGDAVSAIRMFQADESPEAVYARENAAEIEAYPA